MFEYEICNVFDEDLFKKQCEALEKYIPQIKKTDYLEDVDGSQIQLFSVSSKSEIKVINDVCFGISIESEIDLKPFFND